MMKPRQHIGGRDSDGRDGLVIRSHTKPRHGPRPKGANLLSKFGRVQNIHTHIHNN